MAITENLIQDWTSKLNESKESRKADAAREFRAELYEAAFNGRLGVDICKDVDFEQLIEECAPEAFNEFRRGAGAREWNEATAKLWESSLGVLTTNHFQDLLGPLVTVGMWQSCPQAPFSLSSMIPTQSAGCRQTEFWGYHEPGEVVEENENELEETEYKGLPKPVKVSQSIRRKKKYAFGITREALCRDPNGILRKMMQDGGKALLSHKEKLLVDTVFDLFPASGFFRPYIENDTRYRTYYKTGGGPWVNRIIDNNLDGTYAPFDVIDQLVEGMVDPFTGEPVNCSYSNIHVTNRNAEAKARLGLSAVSIAYDYAVPSGTFVGLNARATVEKPQDTLTGGPISMTKYSLPRLKDWYQTVVGLNSSDAAAAARETYLVGDLGQAFVWSEEWPTETLERSGTDKREYFDQEIVWQIKFMQKADPMVVNPRKVISCVPNLADYGSYGGTGVFNWA